MSLFARIFFVGLLALPAAAQVPDLAEYRTVDSALTTSIAPSVSGGLAPQPAYLGVQVSLQPEMRLLIEHVEPDSPAAKAGIKPGQILAKHGDEAVRSVDAFREFLHRHRPGDVVTLGFYIASENKIFLRKLVLGAPSQPLTPPTHKISFGALFFNRDLGAVVAGVNKGSPAEKAQLKPQDLILRANGKLISTRFEFFDFLTACQPNDKIQLLVQREKNQVLVPVTLEGAPDEPKDNLGWDTRTRTLFKKAIYQLAVIPIEFPDMKLNEKITKQDWDDAFFSTGQYVGKKNSTGTTVYGSMNDYYQEVSFGKLKVQGKVFDPVLLTRTRKDYSVDPNKKQLFTDVLDRIVAKDPKALEPYDGFFFLFAGPKFAQVRNNVFWPHRTTMKYQKETLSVFISPEGGEKMATISTPTHEFGHMLGLPDLYALPEVPGMEGVGVWCTMANGDGIFGRPSHFSVWCKETLGWMQPTVIDPSVRQKLILSPASSSPKEAFKVLVRPDGSEYFLLENRIKSGFDKSLPAEGLLIWRVVGKSKPLLEESHGISGPDGPRLYLGLVPYPSKANRSFTPFTTPSSRSPMGGGLPVYITNIQRLADGRITFWIGYEIH